MPTELVPLKFRNVADNSFSCRAKRNNVEYMVTKYNAKWFVHYFDPRRNLNFSTEGVRDFDSRADGEDFCQEIYAGKIDVKQLAQTVAAHRAAKKRTVEEEREKREAQERAEAEQFRNDLAAQGIDLKTFLEFHDAMDHVVNQSILYLMAEEQEGGESRQ